VETSSIERRLAAIIAMDVVAYSRLMGIDEIGTLTALKAHRSQLIDPLVSAHSGRLVKATGDGFLLQFGSVVDAIACAVSIQRGMLSRNAEVPEDRRIVFRIGVNIGDVIVDGGDIFGDGVNVAARLEALCEPGGICISRAANEQVRDKLSLSFSDLGEHTVKNIARAVGVFGLTAQDIAKLPDVPHHRSQPASRVTTQHLSKTAIVAAGACAVVLTGIAVWWTIRERTPAASAPLETQLIAALAKGVPTTSEKYRQDTSAAFVKLTSHRAIAIARRRGGTWRTGNWPSQAIAEEKVLEKCTQFFDEPCAIIASDDAIVPTAANGTWQVSDAPRVRYAGFFNPERIPAVRQNTLQRADVSAYATLPGPKAAAFHAAGALHLVTTAASQYDAEQQALRACNDNPIRKESGGPCYLYAAANKVVLPLRSTVPLAPTAPTTEAPPSAGTTPIPRTDTKAR
jgi:class 3 adenylate cyclase